MAIDKYVRAHTRKELREVAKLANQPAAATPFRAPYASGYVDLSAFAAKQAELETIAVPRFDPPTPLSMAPVSLSALVSSDEPTTTVSARRRRRALALTLAAGGVCAALALAAVVKHTIASKGSDRAMTALATAAPPPSSSPLPAEAVPNAPTAELAKPTDKVDIPPAPQSNKRPGRAHAAAGRAAPVGRTALPAPHPSKSGSGDPLMDAIRQAVAR
jgi:hypothetical protein